MVFFDHVYIDMFRESGCRLVVGWVSSHICCVTSVEFPGFIDGFVENQGLHSPVDSGIGFL